MIPPRGIVVDYPTIAASNESNVRRTEVMQMVMGIAKIPTTDHPQIEHILCIASDGLRYNAGD